MWQNFVTFFKSILNMVSIATHSWPHFFHLLILIIEYTIIPAALFYVVYIQKQILHTTSNKNAFYKYGLEFMAISIASNIALGLRIYDFQYRFQQGLTLCLISIAIIEWVIMYDLTQKILRTSEESVTAIVNSNLKAAWFQAIIIWFIIVYWANEVHNHLPFSIKFITFLVAIVFGVYALYRLKLHLWMTVYPTLGADALRFADSDDTYLRAIPLLEIFEKGIAKEKATERIKIGRSLIKCYTKKGQMRKAIPLIVEMINNLNETDNLQELKEYKQQLTDFLKSKNFLGRMLFYVVLKRLRKPL
jgi:hypothetical protein